MRDETFDLIIDKYFPVFNADDLAFQIAELAHCANLVWGKQRGCIVDDTPWENLAPETKDNKAELIQSYALCKSLTPEEMHENWRNTVKSTHPSNIPYDDLSFAQRAKDFIFVSYCKLYQELLKERCK